MELVKFWLVRYDQLEDPFGDLFKSVTGSGVKSNVSPFAAVSRDGEEPAIFRRSDETVEVLEFRCQNVSNVLW